MVGPKRMLSREISMSRTFKEKARAKKSDRKLSYPHSQSVFIAADGLYSTRVSLSTAKKI